MANHPPYYNQGEYEIIDIIESILGGKFIIVVLTTRINKYMINERGKL